LNYANLTKIETASYLAEIKCLKKYIKKAIILKVNNMRLPIYPLDISILSILYILKREPKFIAGLQGIFRKLVILANRCFKHFAACNFRDRRDFFLSTTSTFLFSRLDIFAIFRKFSKDAKLQAHENTLFTLPVQS